MTAGLGTRLRPFTDQIPKPLFPVLNVPVAQFAVDLAVDAEVTIAVANIHHLPQQAREGLGALDLKSLKLEISDESAELLGSAGGIKKALPLLLPGEKSEDPDSLFFLLNADVLCQVNLAALADRHVRLQRQWGVTMTMAILRSAPPGEKYREVIVDPQTQLITGLGDFKEGVQFYVGAAVLSVKALKDVPAQGPADFGATILDPAIERREVGALMVDGPWYDVGSPLTWWQTHLDLIQKLETGNLPHRWRKRFESTSQRVAPGIWMDRKTKSRANIADWVGPAFYSGGSEGEVAVLPKVLGPSAVIYGGGGPKICKNGIGLKGHWISLSKPE